MDVVLHHTIPYNWEPNANSVGALERLLTKSRRASQKMSIIIVEVDNRWKRE